MPYSAPNPLSLFELLLPLRTLHGTYLTINHSNACITLLSYLGREIWQCLARMVVRAARSQLYNLSERFLESQLSAGVRFERVILPVESSNPNRLLRTIYATLCIIKSTSFHPLDLFVSPFFKSIQCPRWTSPRHISSLSSSPFQSSYPCILLSLPRGAGSQYIESSQSYPFCVFSRQFELRNHGKGIRAVQSIIGVWLVNVALSIFLR